MPDEDRHLCPICGHDAPRAAADGKPRATFPFCSPACKLVDLGRWLDGAYAIAGPPVASSSDDDEPS